MEKTPMSKIKNNNRIGQKKKYLINQINSGLRKMINEKNKRPKLIHYNIK